MGQFDFLTKGVSSLNRSKAHENISNGETTDNTVHLAQDLYSDIDSEKQTIREAAEKTLPIDTVSVFCDTRAYLHFKDKKQANAVSIVLQPDSWDDKYSADFCRQHDIPGKNLVNISPCYFARYMSPFRDGCSQGPMLPPMRVLDKLRLRLYNENAVELYNAIMEGINAVTEDHCNIEIYTYDCFYSGYFVDCGFLAYHDWRNSPHLKKNISLYADMIYNSLFGDNFYKQIVSAVKTETDYVANISKNNPVSLNIGPYTIVLTEPLFSKCEFLIDNKIIDPSMLNYDTAPIYRGWPYFNECDWSNIDYAGFTSEKDVVKKIREYAEADKDGGFHLYSKNSDNWII